MNLIVAYCRNRGIGFQNKLPWKLSQDMNRFKNLTIGNGNNAVVMGKNTWESLHQKYKPLPKRANIVLSTKYDNLFNNIAVVIYSISGTIIIGTIFINNCLYSLV